MFCCLIAIVCSAIPTHIALACEQLSAANGQSKCVVMPFMGQTGMWFTLGEGAQLRNDHLLVPSLQLQLGKYDEIVGEYKRQVSNLAFVAEARGETIDDLQKGLAKETKRANDAETRASPWYKSPFLWGIAGFLVGGVCVKLIVNSK